MEGATFSVALCVDKMEHVRAPFRPLVLFVGEALQCHLSTVYTVSYHCIAYQGLIYAPFLCRSPAASPIQRIESARLRGGRR